MGDAHAVRERLASSRLHEITGVLMSGFSLDHLTYFESLNDAEQAIEHARREGNVDVRPVRQLLRPGGGAVNMAHALARLGVQSRVLARTSPAGKHFLESTVARDGVNVDGVRTDGRLTVTGAIESADGSVMLDTPEEDDVPFAPQEITDAEWARIRGSALVVVEGWVNPVAHELARAVWSAAREAGARTYTDAASPFLDDPPRREKLLDLLASPDLFALSVNPHELGWLVHGRPEVPDDALADAGCALSERVQARVDLHSRRLTASFEGGKMTATAPAFDVTARQATGAGDTWDAGNMLGDVLGLDGPARLLLANALAALYVGAEDAVPPTREEVLGFLAREAAHVAPAREA